MTKKLNSRKVIAIVLPVALLAAAILKVDSLSAGSITLPIGWRHLSRPSCGVFENGGNPFFQHNGWPFISQGGNECVTGINHLASLLNWAVFIGVLLVAVTLLVYLRKVHKK